MLNGGEPRESQAGFENRHAGQSDRFLSSPLTRIFVSVSLCISQRHDFAEPQLSPGTVSRRRFIRQSALALAGAAGASVLAGCDAALQPLKGAKPNFVILFTDDLGYGDISSFGGSNISTPRLDRMGAEGVRLTDFYVPSPFCSQSRFALMTGRYGIRAGIDHVLFPPETIGIPNWEITLGQALKSVGYQTGCIGKWHLGNKAQFLPPRHGFDYFFGLPHSNDMVPLPLYLNETVIQQSPDQDTLTARYTSEALKFISRNQARPFLLYLAHMAPHVPLHTSATFRGTSPRGLYGDVIAEIDWSTGQVLDTLRDLGLDENTLVIFTSDNGPLLAAGGSAGPLRGGKAGVYEGGVRLPCIALAGHDPGGAGERRAGE